MSEETKEKTVFDRLFNVDVSEHIEKKQTGNTSLSYLSWTYAWANVKMRYPSANYEIVRAENGLPYVYDPHTGYMVFTKVTIEGVTHEMWLPVMDGRNEAMLDHPYQKKYKSYTATIEPATMFDINKTIMRCLVKNLAMFGLGLYIYAGEDLPVSIDTNDVAQSWHDRLEQTAAYYCTDIPDENLEMIKKVCEGNDENECKKMYERTKAYLEKKGFKV